VLFRSVMYYQEKKGLSRMSSQCIQRRSISQRSRSPVLGLLVSYGKPNKKIPTKPKHPMYVEEKKSTENLVVVVSETRLVFTYLIKLKMFLREEQ